MRRDTSIVAAIVLLTSATGGSAGPDVVRDQTFADADWSVVSFATGDGGLVEAGQSPDGNPTPSRRLRVVVNAAPSPTESSAIYGANLYAGKTYDPSSRGPIASVDYFEDALLVTGFGDGQATGPALRQSGNVYIRNIGTTPNFSWTPKEDVGIPASGFVRIVDGGSDAGSHPDFSPSGGPIEFGFFRSNSTSIGANGYEIVALIDNWTVLVNTPCVTNDDCAYPDACFSGACVAGTCKATAMACDDGDPCTTDTCVAGACAFLPVTCDDGNPCTTDTCGSSGCTPAPIDCDDGLPCTIDACSGGTCSHDLGFDTILSAIDGLLALLDTPPCAGDGVATRTRKKLVKKLTKARAKLVLADRATRERLLARLAGKAEHLLEVATKVLDKASDGGTITPDCAASVQAYLTSLLTCTNTLVP
jgi:hypothetical protein